MTHEMTLDEAIAVCDSLQARLIEPFEWPDWEQDFHALGMVLYALKNTPRDAIGTRPFDDHS